MKSLYLLSLFIFFTNCSNNNPNDISKSPTLQNHFNKNEIEDLKTIFKFFNQKICSNKIDINKCFYSFQEEIQKEANSGNTELFYINFQDQKQMYQKIKDDTFNQIWIKNPKKHIEFNLKGKYFSFLEELGKTDNNIKEYYNTIKIAGNITPSIASNVISNYESYDINDVRVKLFIAIHYLTLNDQLNRKK